MLDTRMLCKIALNPGVYLRPGIEIKPEDEKVYIDLIQFVQENMLESTLNPKVIKSYDIHRAMDRISTTNVDSSGLEKLLVHFLKLCFIVNVILYQRGYPQVKVLPTFNRGIVGTLAVDIDINGNKLKTWNLITDSEMFTTVFNKIVVTDNLWKIKTLGSIFHEFPKVLNNLNPAGCLHTIVSSEIEPELITILQSIYLAENYKVFVLFGLVENDEDNKGVKMIETSET